MPVASGKALEAALCRMQATQKALLCHVMPVVGSIVLNIPNLYVRRVRTRAISTAVCLSSRLTDINNLCSASYVS